MTDAQLTAIYNQANNIPPGKSPPITTQKIFAAMRAMEAIALPSKATMQMAEHGSSVVGYKISQNEAAHVWDQMAQCHSWPEQTQ